MTLQRKKEVGILAFACTYSVLFFLLVALALQAYSNWSVPLYIVFIVVALGWVAVMTAATAFLVHHKGNNIPLIFLSSVLLLVVGKFSLSSLTGAVLLAIFMYSAQRVIYQEMNSRVVFKQRLLFQGGIRLMIAGLVVSLITLALPLFQDSAKKGALAVPAEYVHATLRPFAPVISRYLPGYAPNLTVNELIDQQLKKESDSLPPGFVIPPEQKQIILKNFSDQFGVQLTGRETISDVVTVYVNRYIQNQLGSNQLLVVIVFLVVILLTMRALLPLIVWPTLGLVIALIYLSQRVGLVYLMKTQVTVERLQL